MNAKILFAEDDERLANVIWNDLRRAGYAVSWANTAAMLDEQLAKGPWDALVLDLYLGETSTAGKIGDIHAAFPRMKIVVASSELKGDVIAQCLSSGASEHIKKPYDIGELLFKLENILPSALVIGKYRLYPETFELVSEAGRTKLAARECLLLRALAEAKGEIVTYAAIYREFGEKKPSEGTLYNLVSRVRGFLKDDEGISIENVKGLGFRMAY